MKIKNIFKKESTTANSSSIQKMDKKHLEKVIGGGAINTSRSNVRSPTSLDGDLGSTGDTATTTSDSVDTTVAP